MLHTLYMLTAIFIFYSFLGWVVEVIYHVVAQGIIVNRGFLNGPLCPIYGLGMLSVVTLLGPLSDSFILLCLGGLIFATAIELVGGFLLFKLFHMRWWDYSSEPFNLGGYICLRFSLAWGICVVFAVDILNPSVEKLIRLLDNAFGYAFMGVIMIVFVADLICTICTVAKFNRDLAYLDEIGKKIHGFSDELTDKIGGVSYGANVKVQEGRVQAALGKKELMDEYNEKREKLVAEYNERKEKLVKNVYFGYGRLMRAFPRMKHAFYDVELSDVKTSFLDKLGKLKNRKHDNIQNS